MKFKLPDAASEAPAALACAIALRAARTDRKLSLRQLAMKLGLHPATLSSWELGQRLPDSEVVARVLGFLRVSAAEFDRILALCRRTDDLSLVEVLEADTAPLLWTYEQVAAGAIEWAPAILPELLQTPDYARLILAGGFSVQDDVDLNIFTRMARQDILRRNELSTQYTFYLSEDALSLPRNSHAILIGQLRHLWVSSKLPKVSIRILDSNKAFGSFDKFVMYQKVNTSLVVVLQHDFCNIYLANPQQVSGWRETARQLSRLALDDRESRDLISSKIGELELSEQHGRDTQSGESDRCA